MNDGIDYSDEYMAREHPYLTDPLRRMQCQKIWSNGISSWNFALEMSAAGRTEFECAVCGKLRFYEYDKAAAHIETPQHQENFLIRKLAR